MDLNRQVWSVTLKLCKTELSFFFLTCFVLIKILNHHLKVIAPIKIQFALSVLRK